MPSRIKKSKRGSGHSYFVDGNRVPGVTTILRNGVPKHALPRWYATKTAQWAVRNTELITALGDDAWVKQAADAPNLERDTAATRGKDLHSHALALLSGKPVEVPPEQLDLVEGVADFLERWDAEEIAAERPCYSLVPLYAGTFDLIATLRDGSTWLLDYKTGSGVYPETALQLAAYASADFYQTEELVDAPMPTIDRLGVVHVTPDGWELRPVDGDRELLEDVFVACALVAQYVSDTDGYPNPRWNVIGGPLPDPAGIGVA